MQLRDVVFFVEDGGNDRIGYFHFEVFFRAGSVLDLDTAFEDASDVDTGEAGFSFLLQLRRGGCIFSGGTIN